MNVAFAGVVPEAVVPKKYPTCREEEEEFAAVLVMCDPYEW